MSDADADGPVGEEFEPDHRVRIGLRASAVNSPAEEDPTRIFGWHAVVRAARSVWKSKREDAKTITASGGAP